MSFEFIFSTMAFNIFTFSVSLKAKGSPVHVKIFNDIGHFIKEFFDGNVELLKEMYDFAARNNFVEKLSGEVISIIFNFFSCYGKAFMPNKIYLLQHSFLYMMRDEYKAFFKGPNSKHMRKDLFLLMHDMLKSQIVYLELKKDTIMVKQNKLSLVCYLPRIVKILNEVVFLAAQNDFIFALNRLFKKSYTYHEEYVRFIRYLAPYAFKQSKPVSFFTVGGILDSMKNVFNEKKSFDDNLNDVYKSFDHSVLEKFVIQTAPFFITGKNDFSIRDTFLKNYKKNKKFKNPFDVLLGLSLAASIVKKKDYKFSF